MDTFCINKSADTRCSDEIASYTPYLGTMTWQARAVFLMKTKGVTQDDLATALDLTRGAIGHYLQGRRTPSPDQLLTLAKRLGVTMSELMGDGAVDRVDAPPSYLLSEPGAPLSVQESATTHAARQAHDEARVYVNKVVGARLSAGPGQTAYDFEEIESSHAFQRDWMQKNGLKPERCKLWDVHGDSMWPTIPAGTMVLLNMAEREPISGKVYALVSEDGLRLKRLIRRNDGVWEIHSDNPVKTLFPTESFVPGTVAIMGRVRWYAGEL